MSSIFPSRPTVPASGSAAKAATTRRAWATSSGEGEKAALIAATCVGWIAIRPENPLPRCRLAVPAQAGLARKSA